MNLSSGRHSRFSRSRRRGISVILVAVVLVVLVAFVSLAVDIGRVRVAKVQLQTAADSAATAAVSGLELMPANGVVTTEERAVEAAAANFAINQSQQDGERADSAVTLVPDEDIALGRWDPVSREFIRLEETNGGIDERRQADAVRVWTRRVTRFRDYEGDIVERGTGLPLIFAPIIGVAKGEIQAEATAVLNGSIDGAAFVGLEEVNFNGAALSDSYAAASETYPGVGGANRGTSIASNGDIEFTGAANILGSVYPGANHWILPRPLPGNINITGYMFPLSKPLVAATPPYDPPLTDYNTLDTYQPRSAISDTGEFQAHGTTVLQGRPQSAGQTTKFVFTAWNSGGNTEVTIDNSQGPIEIWVNGGFTQRNKSVVKLTSAQHPVTFHVNGNMDLLGNGVVHAGGAVGAKVGLPRNLQILMSGPNTTLRIGGTQAMFAHVSAPSSAIVFSSNGTEFFGRAIGRTLTVSTNVQLHYDESLLIPPPKFQIRLVD